MTRSHVFDPHLATANRWLDQLIENLDLAPTDRSRALHALRAGLHAIRDRLPAAEVVDLGAQLPTLIRGLYYEGWTLANDPTRIRDRAAMIARVEKELTPDPRLDPVDVLRAVIHLLVEHVSPGEILDVVATLPRPIAHRCGRTSPGMPWRPLPPADRRESNARELVGTPHARDHHMPYARNADLPPPCASISLSTLRTSIVLRSTTRSSDTARRARPSHTGSRGPR